MSNNYESRLSDQPNRKKTLKKRRRNHMILNIYSLIAVVIAIVVIAVFGFLSYKYVMTIMNSDLPFWGKFLLLSAACK